MLEKEQGDRNEMLTILKLLFVLFCSLFIIYNHYSAKPKVTVRTPMFSLLGPYNSSQHKLDDNFNQLIDIKNFSFKINPQPCKDYNAGILLVIIVSSNPINFQKRNIIRRSWGRSIDSTKTIFLIGETKNETTSQQILKESKKCGDIVQGTFIDAYRNMTYKHVMGFKWVANYCPMAKYVLKADDDTIVDSHALRHFLARELSPWGAQGLIACDVMLHSKVMRNNSKWKVSEAEFAGTYYPRYCSGYVILYSQDVINRLLTIAQSTPYFWIDDVHLTGVLAERIGVARTSLSTLVMNRKRAEAFLILGPSYPGPYLFGPPNLSVNKMAKFWKSIPK